MSQIIRSTIVLILLLCSASELTAATPAEFYGTLLRRGVGEFDAGRFAEATRYLRLAAFGFVDTVDQYQTAQTYLAVAYDRLGDADRARDAAMRILRAERVARRFAALPLPASVRAQFDRIAPRLLTAGDLAALRGSEPLPPLPSQVATTRPAATQTGTQTQTPPVVVDRVDVEVTRPTTQTAGSTTTTPRAQPDTTRTPDPAAGGTNGSTRPASMQPRPTTPATTQPATTQPAQAQPTTPVTAQPATTQPATRPATPETPRPATTQPATQPATTETPRPTATQPAIQPATSQTPRPATTQPATATQQPVTPARPATTTPAPQRAVTFTASQIASRLASAERALTTSNLAEARRIYHELLGSTTLDHATAISIAEGLYRSRDFAGALGAFGRAGGLRRGEEPYRYYVAVALYETGRYTEARRELVAALPHIEITPDVARYRSKIESAVE